MRLDRGTVPWQPTASAAAGPLSSLCFERLLKTSDIIACEFALSSMNFAHLLQFRHACTKPRPGRARSTSEPGLVCLVHDLRASKRKRPVEQAFNANSSVPA